MTHEKQQHEPYPGYHAHRIAEAVGLLSLDSVRPVFSCLELPNVDHDLLQKALRQAIIENRQEFERNPSQLPDLRSHVCRTVSALFGESAVHDFEIWLGSTYIFSSEDYRSFNGLRSTLSELKRQPVYWNKLAIPPHLLNYLKNNIDDRTALDCFHKTYDPDDNLDLSNWDVEVYVRLKLYQEFSDPYFALYNTADWIDFRRILDWFIANTSAEEQEAFRASAETLKEELIPELNAYKIKPLKELVARHV
jgi:hypothetical protein